MYRTLALTAALIATACTHGPRLERIAFPTRPIGADASIATAGLTYAGELITAADTGFVILLNTNRLVYVPASAVRQLRVESLGVVSMPVRGRTLEKVRLVSRHPYGMPGEARAALLAFTGQSDFDRAGQ